MPGERPMGNWLPVVLLLALGVAALYRYEPAREAVGSVLQALRTLPAPGDSSREAEPERAAPPVREEPASPPLADRVLEALPALAPGVLREVVDLSSEGMQAALGPAGQVLLTSKYRVMRLGAGNPNDRRSLFSSELYREQFPGRRLQAMASALALPGERYLLGGWHGEVLLWSGGRLQLLSDREQRPKGRIAAMLLRGDEALVAGDGLWRLGADGQTLQELALPGGRRLRALAQHGEQLLIAEDGRRIHRWTANGAEPWLELPRDDERVEALDVAGDDDWWIASTRGLYRVDREGRPLERLLEGIWVSTVLERPGELWVGSWKQGLLLRREGRWYRLGEGYGGLASESVSGFTVDAADHAWLTLYGGGGWQAPLSSLRAALLQRPWTPVPDLGD